MIPERDLNQIRSLSRATGGGTLDALRLAERAYLMGSEACHQAIFRELKVEQTLNLNALTKYALRKALLISGGNIQSAARLLGIGKTTAYRKAKTFGLLNNSTHRCPNCGHYLGRNHEDSSRLERAAQP